MHLTNIEISFNESQVDKSNYLTTEQAHINIHFTFLHINTDPQTGVVTEAIRNRNMRSRYRWSMCPANHINSRSLLRSSSTREPSDPPHRVVFVLNKLVKSDMFSLLTHTTWINAILKIKVCFILINKLLRALFNYVEIIFTPTQLTKCRSSCLCKAQQGAMHRYPTMPSSRHGFVFSLTKSINFLTAHRSSHCDFERLAQWNAKAHIVLK